MSAANTTRDAVLAAVRNAMREAGQEVADIQDSDHLGDTLKLSSLDFAVVVVNLETTLGVDPFRKAAPRVQTFGQLVELYEKAKDQSDEE